ncbi:hypothetical protein VTK56DRAFT_6348 [Thermocarpiscus australiensis]
MDPRDQTFITIHNLTPDANILFASDSILDILGYEPDEVKGKSCFDYVHPDEVPFARSVHSRGVLLDKAAVLHYTRILSKTGRWVSCECCFTVVHNVLVASTSIYFKGEKSERRAREAPQVGRIFSGSPRDPRYQMLEHLSPKFTMPPMEREPRAALILNRFTRNLAVMYATDAVTQILGLRPSELLERPFYDCIQPNCLEEAERCLESAKANESIAYLRFWYKDPRIEVDDPSSEEEEKVDDMDDESDSSSSAGRSGTEVEMSQVTDGRMEINEEQIIPTENVHVNGGDPAPSSSSSPTAGRRRPTARQSFEIEAVVSCTSDGLVVVLRRARAPFPGPQAPLLPEAFNYENGLFAAPWGLQLIEPHISPELLYTFRPPFLPQYMPLRECVRVAGRPPRDQLMRSIQDVAVFAWAITGINGTLATYGHGRPPRMGGQPGDGLPVCERSSFPAPHSAPRQQTADGHASADMHREVLNASPSCNSAAPYQSGETWVEGYPRARHASLDEGTYDSRQTPWAATTTQYRYGGGRELGQYRDPLRPSPTRPLTTAIGGALRGTHYPAAAISGKRLRLNHRRPREHVSQAVGGTVCGGRAQLSHRESRDISGGNSAG